MTRISYFMALISLLVLMGNAQAQDRYSKLIEFLKGKGIISEEELAQFEQETATPPAGGISERQLEKAIDDALDARKDTGSKLHLPVIQGLKISFQNRIRGELHHNHYMLLDPMGTERYDLIRMRNRLRFDFDVNEYLEAVMEFQDVRIFGEGGSTVTYNTGVTGFDLKRGKVKFKNLGDVPLSFEAGRFVLSYGDQRLIGDLEWLDQGRSYDGARLSYCSDEFFVDLFGVRVRDELFFKTAPGPINDDQELVGLYGGTRMKDSAANFEGYALLLRDQSDRIGESGNPGHTLFTTVGGRVHGEANLFDYALEGAIQFGEVADDDLFAYAFSGRAGFTLEDVEMKPRLGVEVNYASGNDDFGDKDTETFQTLFPDNHTHYGYADLAAWSNTFNVKAGVSLWPCEQVKMSADFIHLRLADPKGGWINAGGGTIRTGVAGDSRHLGDELDFTFKWWMPYKPVSFLLGWSHFFDGAFVRNTGGGGDADFFYLHSFVNF